MINQNLLDLLQKLQREGKPAKTFFLIPSGLLDGKFLFYKDETVTLSECKLSGISIDAEITIWVGIIHGWGTNPHLS